MWRVGFRKVLLCVALRFFWGSYSSLSEEGSGFLMARAPSPNDLPAAHWHILEPLLPASSKGGRSREGRLLEGRRARVYLLRSGGVWRMLPHGFPPWQPGYSYLRR